MRLYNGDIDMELEAAETLIHCSSILSNEVKAFNSTVEALNRCLENSLKVK
jgi:hypothetical protein